MLGYTGLKRHLYPRFGRLLIAAVIVNQRQYNGVYDYQQSKHISASSSNVETNTPSFWDFNRDGAISGNTQGMYDYPTSSHVSINVQGSRMDCYDYETRSHITFHVNGNSVSAYDFETSSHYNYSVN